MPSRCSRSNVCFMVHKQTSSYACGIDSVSMSGTSSTGFAWFAVVTGKTTLTRQNISGIVYGITDAGTATTISGDSPYNISGYDYIFSESSWSTSNPSITVS